MAKPDWHHRLDMLYTLLVQRKPVRSQKLESFIRGDCRRAETLQLFLAEAKYATLPMTAEKLAQLCGISEKTLWKAEREARKTARLYLEAQNK